MRNKFFVACQAGSKVINETSETIGEATNKAIAYAQFFTGSNALILIEGYGMPAIRVYPMLSVLKA